MRWSVGVSGALTLLILAAGCVSTGQLPLGGDRECSSAPDISLFACGNHDNCYWFGGTEQDRHVCDAEFLADLLIDDVPFEAAWVYFAAVHRYGGASFTYRSQRTRGPPK